MTFVYSRSRFQQHTNMAAATMSIFKIQKAEGYATVAITTVIYIYEIHNLLMGCGGCYYVVKCNLCICRLIPCPH